MTTDKVKVTLSGTENDGGVKLAIAGVGPGGHTASIRYLDPDYGPVFWAFDGGEGLTDGHEKTHASVIVTIDGDAEYRAELEPFKSPEPQKKAAPAPEKKAGK